MPRLVYISTHPIALRTLAAGQLAHFRQQGYEVIAVASPGDDLNAVETSQGVQVVAVPMAREISPLADLVSLWRMWRLLRRLKPDIVNAGTAKAAMLGMVAAWAARVPARIYLLRGLRLETTSGLKRRVLTLAERVTACCAQRILCISKSLAEVYTQMGFAPPEKLRVLAHGSSNGIDAARYLATPQLQQQAAKLRADWGLNPDTPVIGFVGRFVRDKGVVDLLDAFDLVLKEFPHCRLLMVGDFETGDPVPPKYVERIQSDPSIIRPGWIENPAPYYAAMDVLAFPTYREGFGNVSIEAAAAGKPVVVYRSTGAVDTVRDGVTGTIVGAGDSVGLAAALIKYFADPKLRAAHGAAGCEMAQRDFRPELIWEALAAQYREMLALDKK